MKDLEIKINKEQEELFIKVLKGEIEEKDLSIEEIIDVYAIKDIIEKPKVLKKIK